MPAMFSINYPSPDALDASARWRFSKRIYIPMPDVAARTLMISRKLDTHAHTLTKEQRYEIATLTEGGRVDTHTAVYKYV